MKWALTLLCLSASVAQAQDLDQVRKAASSIHEQGDFPTELHRKPLTEEELELPQGVSDFLGDVFDGLGDAARVSAPVAKWGLILLAAILVILFALAIYRLRPRVDLVKKREPKRSKKVAPRKTETDNDPGLSESALADLLAKGLYAEAAAYLLRLMIKDLGYDRDIEQQSLTPREVSALIRSSELESAVRLAEQVRFAGQPASQQTIDMLQVIRGRLRGPAAQRTEQSGL